MTGNDNHEDRDFRNGDFRDDDFRDDDLRDDDLRARFAELKREEEEQAPEFILPSPEWAGLGRRWSAGKLVAGAVCLLAIAAATFLLRLVPYGVAAVSAVLPSGKRSDHIHWRAQCLH